MQIEFVYEVDMDKFLDQFDGDAIRGARFLEEVLDVESGLDVIEGEIEGVKVWIANTLVTATHVGDMTDYVRITETRVKQ